MSNRHRINREQIRGAVWLSVFLAALLAVVEFSAGAVIPVTTTDGLVRAINAAQPGDVLQLNAKLDFGTQQLFPKSFITIRGGGLKFTRPKPANLSPDAAGIVTPAGCDSFVLDGVELRSNNGVIYYQPGAKNCAFINNDVQWGYDGNYYNRLAIRALNGHTKLKITGNWFHDSPNSDRTVDLTDTTDCDYSSNKFWIVNDGGHVDGQTIRFRFVGNWARRFHRMGLELQDQYGNPGDDILIDGNDFEEWSWPFHDSFGLSIMPQRATHVRITNNRGVATIVPGETYLKPGDANDGRFGYAIEAGFEQSTGMVAGNSFGGGSNTQWVAGISTSMRGTPVKDNRGYGLPPAWNWFYPEPGPLPGVGSFLDLGGNQMGLPLPVPATQPATQPSLAPTGVTVTIVKADPDYVVVNWTNTAPAILASRVDVTSTKGREKLKPTEVSGGLQAARVLVHQGWEQDFTVTSRTVTGEYTSAPVVGVLTAGSGTAPYPPVPVTQPSTQPTPEELVLRAAIKDGGEVVIPAGKTIETHETLLLPNYLELRGTGARLNYTGDPNKPAVSYSASYPYRTSIKGLTIKSTGRGIALEREGSHLQIRDVEIDSDREPVYFVPANGPDGRPTQFVYSPTFDHLIVTNPRAETHLRVRMATLSHLMFQFGGATTFRGDALLKLDGDGSQGSLECLWDEPAFPIDQVKVGQPGTNFAHWDITVPWYEPNKTGARVDATNAIIHTPYAYAQLGSPWVLRNSTVYTSELTAIGALGEVIDPKLTYQGDATSKMYLHGAAVPLGTIPATQPSH